MVGPPRWCYNPAELVVLWGRSYNSRPESCDSTRYISIGIPLEWRLIANLLERGVAKPIATVRFPVVTKAPRTLISAREEYEASSRRTGERGAALEYPRSSVPVLPL